MKDNRKLVTIIKKHGTINSCNHWILLITSFLSSAILLISWIIYTSFYKNDILAIIEFININLKTKESVIIINWNTFSLLFLIIAACGFVGVFFPLFLIRKKSFLTNIIIFFTFIYCIIIFAITVVLILVIFKETKFTVKQILLLSLPFALVSLFAIILFINNFWLLFATIKSYWQTKKSTIKSAASTLINLNAPTTGSTANLIIPEIKILINNDKVITDNTTSFSQTKNLHINDFSEENTFNEQNPWTKEEIDMVWSQATIIPGYDKNLYRKDYAEALIFKNSFVAKPEAEKETNIKSYNWTITPKIPFSKGGKRSYENLMASHTINFLAKGEDYPKWKTIISYNGTENIYKTQNWKDKSNINHE